MGRADLRHRRAQDSGGAARRTELAALGAGAVIQAPVASAPAGDLQGLQYSMSRVTSYWAWSESGAYHGMPWMNLVGGRLGCDARLALLVIDQSSLGHLKDNGRLPFGLSGEFCAASGILSARSITGSRPLAVRHATRLRI